MRKLMLILVFFAAIACEEEGISGDVYFDFSTMLSENDTTNQFPKGLNIEYIKAGELIKDTCRYVGKGFKVEAIPGQRCYLKATSEHKVRVRVTQEGSTLFYSEGYQIAVIDEIY